MTTIRRCSLAAALMLALGAPPPVHASDVTAPTVELTAPADGSVVGGTVTLAATAPDDAGVDRVNFFVDGAFLESDSTAPYEVSLFTNGFLSGSHHTVSARAVDTAGLVGAEASRTITVDNTTPDVAITGGPADGAHIAQGVTPTYTYTTSDALSGIGTVECGLDGVLPATCPVNGSKSLPALPAGTYLFQVRATDKAGNTSLAAREIIVDAAPATTTPTTPTAPPTTPTAPATIPATTAISSGAGALPSGAVAPLVVSRPPPVLERLRRSFRVTGAGTRIAALAVEVLDGAKVVAACRGAGCPFKRRAARVRSGTANVAALVGTKRVLRAGARLVVTITAPDGRVVRLTFAFRRAAAPKITVA